MDPKDPNNVGLKAKDSNGSKADVGKKPGKVANTDHYGNGGAGGETKVPGKKSGTENLPEGRNGKESKAAENKAAGKSTPPANLAPLAMPPAKELPAPQLKKPSAAAKAKAGGAGAAKTKKSGDSNHVTAVTPVQTAPTILPLTPLPSEPAKVIDTPTVAPIDTVVVAPPTNGKAHPLHDALRAEVATVGEAIKAAHTEILSVAKSLEKAVAAQLQTYAASIDARVQTGTQRVGNAYSGLSTAITTAVASANEAVTKREQEIPAKIKQVRDAKAEELKATVAKVKADTTAAIVNGPEAAAARKTAIGFADKLEAMGKSLSAEIKQKTSEGGELSKGLNPKKYSNQIMFGGEGTRPIGHQALVEDKRLSLITTAGKSAIALIDGTVATLGKDYREHSDAKLTEALKGSNAELDKVITDVHEPEQKKHLDAAATLATETLHKQVASSRTGIAKVQKDATAQVAKERHSAEDGARKAGKALSDNIKHGAKEIESRIAAKGAQDAANYNKLNGELKKISKSKKLDAATKARLDSMKADLAASLEQNKQTLQQIATTSVDDLKRDKEKQYEDAIAGYEQAAAKTKTELVGKVTAATTQLGTSFDTIGTSFDSTVKSETDKMKVEFEFYTKEAHNIPDTMQKALDKLVQGTEKGLRDGTTKMLETETVQAKLNKKSEPMVTAAMKTGQENAQNIWDAMDGAGTDENKIFSALRTATPGEVVYIEAIYNAAYPKRGTADYPSPLQADLDDELSGSEWDIAFAYLRHQRERALKLELDDSRGIFNDEEERIEEVLKAASDDELKNILSSEDGKATLERVKGCLSGCDLDVVNALTEVDKNGMPVADRKIKADAIRIYDAMYGGTGIGTDEEKIKKILESTTDPEERKKLHAAYNEYIRKKDPVQAQILMNQSGKDADLMDASIDDEMSGGEWTETRAMAESDLSQDDHLKMVKMAKVVDGAHGAGTDEDKITDNIETDEAYFEKYKAEKDPLKRKAMAEGREKAMNARLRWLEGERVDENGQPLLDKDGKPLKKGPNVMTSRFQGDTIADIIKGEMGSEEITFEELEQGKWGPYPDRGEKNGQQVQRALYQQRAWMGALNLEYMVAQRKLQAGSVDPELLIAYACWGVTGTDEANLKKGVRKGGEVYSKAEIKDLRNRFKHCWGVDLYDGSSELERMDFKQPTGTVPSEVDGKDWLEIRIALMGRPETPQEIAYVDNVRYKFVTSGSGNTSPWSHAREDMDVNHKRIQDECAKAVAENKPLNSFDAADKNKKPDRKKFAEGEAGDAAFKKAEEEFYASDAATAGTYMEENRLEILSGYAEKSEMAFLTAKEAMTDAIITVIELIGAALITAASMGASSPMLAMFIGNLILSGMTIIMRKEMNGDAYGSEAIGIDVIKGIVMAGIQAAGEAKVVADFAKKAGQMGGKAFAVFTGGAEKAGMRVVGKEGLEVAEQAALRLETKVGTKMATESAEKVAQKEATTVAEKAATKEVTNVAEKTATKEATDVAEKTATKEATNVAEKTAQKEATAVAEKAAAKETGEAVAKKTAQEQVESAVESGTKNAVNSAMSESATFLMDEKTWEMKGFDAVFGENSLGAKLLKKLPSAFAQGAVSDYIQNLAHVSSPDKVRGPTSGSEATFRNILAEIGGNTAGFLTYLDNYSDAQTFWQELFKSNMQSLGSGALSGYLNHRQRAVKLGVDAHKALTGTDQSEIASIKAQLHEADGYMETHEKQRLVDRILQEKNGADVIQHLPESFQKLAGKAKQTGGDVTGDGGEQKSNKGKTATEEKNEAAAKKQEVKDEVKKNQQANDEESAKKKQANDEEKKNETEATNKKPANDEAKNENKAKVDVPEPKLDAPKTPQQLALEAQHVANRERIAALADKQAKFAEIDHLASLAKTREDWEFIRQLEHEAGRPISERYSPDDKQATLQALAKEKHHDEAKADEHAAAIKDLQKDIDPEVAKKKAEHQQAVTDLTKETKDKIAVRDDAVTKKLVDMVKTAPTDDKGRKVITLEQAVSLGMGGASAAGANVGNHKVDANGVRTDRIGIEDGDRPELWGTLGHKTMGQEAAAVSYGTGGIKTTDIAEHPTAQVATAAEIALQVAAQRDASKVGTVASKGPAGELEYHTITKPDGTQVIEVGIPIKIALDPTKPHELTTVVVKTQAGVDISSGLGKARELSTVDAKDGSRKAQISKDDAQTLSKDIMSGEEALAKPAESFKDKRVLGIGGGPTSEWAMEHALLGGAASVEVAGQMPRPSKDSDLHAPLTKVENDIRALVDAGKPVPKELTDKHHAIIATHVGRERARLADLDQKLTDTNLSPREREKLTQERDKLRAGIDPFAGSRVDRNHNTLNNEDITHVQADVIKVRPTEEVLPDGTKRQAIEVVYADGTKRIVDQVIPSIGADPEAAGGINQLMRNAPEGMKMIPVISGGRVVGLASDPPGITISGAVMTSTLGTNMPEPLLKRIPPEMRDAVLSSIIDHANRDGVSDGSKGIIPGIENVGSNPELMQKVMELPPDKRKAALEDFLRKYKENRDLNFGGENRFDDKTLRLDKKPAPNADEEKKTVAKTNDDNGEKSTKSGAKFNPSTNEDHNPTLAGNETTVTPHIQGRAKAALDAMSVVDRKAVDDIMALATTKGQKSMLEKAIAAGRKPHELEILRAAMAGMNDVEIAKQFSGAGVIQFFHQSCAPTAYQIAIADVDPFFAFYLRQHPELVMDAQSNALVINGGAQTKRDDIDNPKKEAATNLQPHLDDQSMGSKLKNQDSYSTDGHKGGIDMPDLDGSNLHKLLEKTTGVQYEVVTHQDVPFKNKGAGTYDDSTAPHDRIIAAVQAGHPVIVGQYLPGMGGGGHAMVIVGVEVSGHPPNRTVTYMVRDPMSGTVSPMPQQLMDRLGTQGFTLPKVAKATDEASTVKKQGPEDEKSTKTGAHDDDQAKKTTTEDGKHENAKPKPETFEEAHERRSQGVKPKNPEHEGTFASPKDRKGVANEVPLSRQELRDILVAKYGKFLQPWLEAKHTAHDMWLPLIAELHEIQTGAGAKDKTLGPKYEEKFRELSKKIAEHEAAQGNKKELDDTQLRSFYNLVEKEDMRTIWHAELAKANLPPEQVAKLMSMYREELKLMVRDLMQDDNATEVLMQRDRIVYGDRSGPQFDDIFNKNLKKDTSADSQQDKENKAYKGIVDSSMRSNEEMNLKLTGYKDGIDPEVGNKIREGAQDPKKTLPAVKAANEALLSGGDEKSTKTGASEGAASKKVQDEQLLQTKRQGEINLSSDGKDVPYNAPTAAERSLRDEFDHLWELRESLKKTKDQAQIDAIKDAIIKARAKLDEKLVQAKTDKDLKDQLLDPHVAFALAREANVTDKKLPEELHRSKELASFLGENIDQFRKAQDQARQGVDTQLRAKREVFEREVAKAILHDEKVSKAVNDNLTAMAKKAHDYIVKTRGLGTPEYYEAMASLGAHFSDGYAGAVLTEKGNAKVAGSVEAANKSNGKTMEAVLLEDGNVRERMIAIGKFAELVAGDMITKPETFKKAADTAGDGKDGGFSQKEVEALVARMEIQKKDMGFKGTTEQLGDADYIKAIVGGFLKPNSKEKADTQADFQAAKKQEMDAKIPSVAQGTKTEEFADTKLPETGAGEKSSLARTTITLDEAEAMGFKLSEREKAIAKANGNKLPWVVGTIANVVDPDSDFISKGAQASLPQKAGISGTTFRFMEASALLDGDPMKSRMAMIAALQIIDAHTIYEIANASKDFGKGGKGGELDFNAARPYDNIGLSREQLEKIALDTGTTFAELNGETKAKTPDTKSE